MTASPVHKLSAPGANTGTRALPLIELDVLRGWSERLDPELRSEHLLPSLARLVPLQGGPGASALPGARPLTLHGPQVVLGRYHPQHGPVDLTPSWWSEAQLYKLGSPHVRLALQARGWRLWAISPGHLTLLNGQPLSHEQTRGWPLASGDQLTLGAVTLRFEVGPTTLPQWERRLQDMLKTVDHPTLWLKRHGGLCGPMFRLTPRAKALLGRAFPGRGSPGLGPLLPSSSPDWDLAGLYEHERRHLGFRHASLDWSQDAWELNPISRRQKVWLNRRELQEPERLTSGDEIGLGGALLHFHDPKAPYARLPELPVPKLIDWDHEHVSEADED